MPEVGYMPESKTTLLFIIILVSVLTGYAIPSDMSETLYNAYNIKSYGAKGDGKTDDTSAVQAAVDAATNGGVIYLPLGTYVVNGQVNITSKTGIVFTGVRGQTVITTTQTAKDGSHYAFFYFRNTKHCEVSKLTFDETVVVDKPLLGVRWLSSVYAENCTNFSVRDCHFIETVSSGITISGGTLCIIDGVTSQGVRAFGSSPEDANAMDGNFINVYGDYNYQDDVTGGNVVVNCRIDGYSSLTNYHWNDFPKGRASRVGIWHDNNCGILTEPLGNLVPYAPNNLVANNYIAHFGNGGYTENPEGKQGGRQIFSNNIVYECYQGYEIQNTGKNTKISGNYFKNIAGPVIVSHCAENIDISNNLVDDYGLHMIGDEVTKAISAISSLPGQGNVNIIGNIISVKTRNLVNGIPQSRTGGIHLRASSGYSIRNINIKGNTLSLNGLPYDSETPYGAILIEGAISDIVINGNVIADSPGCAISMTLPPGGTASECPERIVISDNSFSNNNLGASSLNCCILAHYQTQHIVISDNFAKGNNNTVNFLDARESVDHVFCDRNRMIDIPYAYSWESKGVDFSWDGIYPFMSKNPAMAGDEMFDPGQNLVFFKDTGGINRNFNPKGHFVAGARVILVNSSKTSGVITFDSYGTAQKVAPNECGVFTYNGTAWQVDWLGRKK